jgi:hypothetical protein
MDGEARDADVSIRGTIAALLSGKEVERIERASQNEIVIFFAGGARLFLEVDSEGNITLSVTGA